MLLRCLSSSKREIFSFLIIRLFALLSLFTAHLVVANPITESGSRPVLELVITEYPPFIGNQLLNKGLVADICVQAFEKMGYRVNVTSYPFARAIYLLRSGAVDGFLGLWYREEREGWANYSRPLVSQDMVLIKRLEQPIDMESWGALRQYRIGTVISYVNPPLFDENAVETEPVSDDSINFRKLLFGRIDMALTGRNLAEYVMETSSLPLKNNLEIIPEALGQESFHFASSKANQNHQELVESLEAGINKLESSDTLAQIFSAHGFDKRPLSAKRY